MEHPAPPASAVTELRKLPSLLLAWRLSYTLFCAALGALLLPAAALLAADEWAPGLALLVGGALGMASLFGAAAYFYAGRRYALYQAHFHAGQGVVLRSGVWWRSQVWVPLARLQHIDVNQGPLDRKWGMATLALHTAGTHDHETRIAGMPLGDANALRAELLASVRGEHG
jgi:membrane protein YdbS with pleckstrin-like domain